MLLSASTLCRGAPCELFCHASSTPAALSQLVCSLDRQGGRRAGPRPRALSPGDTALVQLTLERAICLELYRDCRSMGRVVLRDGGKTLAAGVVTAILE